MEDHLLEGLKAFRNLISRDAELGSCPTDDDFLMKFLRAKDMKVASALVTLKKYIQMRRSTKVYNPESVREAFESGMISVLKHRDSEGRQILHIQTSKWDTQKLSSEQMILSGTLVLEQMICSVQTQENGVIVVHDQEGLTFTHCSKLGLREITKMIGIFQGSFPVRLKQNHQINEPRIFGVLYSIAYPFLSAKMKKRLHIHGNNLNSLHKFLPREILPESLGGDLPSDLAEDKDVISELLAKDAFFKATTDFICQKQ